MDFKRGDIVNVLDYPFGRPINVYGKVVGVLKNDFYNIFIQSGLYEGQIKKFKYWRLSMKSDETE